MRSGRLVGFVDKPPRDPLVRVDPPVAEERPAAAGLFDAGEVDLGDERLFAVGRRLGENGAERVAEETRAPELDAGGRGVAGRLLEADAVDGRDEDAACDGVAALDGAPGLPLGRPVRRLLGRMPPDGGRIEEDLGALEGRQPRGLRVPLVPADERAEAAEPRVEGAK
jgi:hypothetical protein